MNKYLIFIATMLMMYQGYAQCDLLSKETISVGDISSCGITPISTSNQTLTARSQITLNAGFKASNTSTGTNPFSLTIKTDNAILLPTINTLPTVGTKRTALDVNSFIPGTIQGNIDVNPNGSTSYSIPLVVSPGSHGVQPQISINYSGQSGRGEFGWGWHLGGLSKISSIGANMYDDGEYLSSLGLYNQNQTNNFTLDGQRLIPSSTNTFSLQNNPYTLVTGSINDGFTVTSQNGTITEYGRTDDSRFNASFCAINKITDADGNYIEYNYYSDINTGEFRIREINYTGNGSLKPYNSIKFYYTKTNETNTSYISFNQKVLDNSCISSIKVFTEGTATKEYSFSYFFDGFNTKLNYISFTNEGLRYNPTNINWGTSTLFDTQYFTSLTTKETELATVKGNFLYTADVNGDGKTDVIKFQEQNASFLTTIISGSTVSDYFTLPPGYKDLNFIDWDNDGKDELIIHRNSGGSDFFDVYKFVTTWTLFSSKNIGGSATVRHYYGDINGDGLIEKVSLKGDSTLCMAENKNGFVFNNPYVLHGNLSSDNNADIDDIKFLDFDGDGQLEIMIHRKAISNSKKNTKSVYAIYKYYQNDFVEIEEMQWNTSPQNVVLGDFNGDGKTDILEYNNGWKLHFSREITFGNRLVDGSLPSNFQQSVPYYVNFAGEQSSICTDDLNGDGKSDIAYGSYGSLYIYLSNGNSFTLAKTISGLPSGSCYVSTALLDFPCLKGKSPKELKQILYGSSDGAYQIFSSSTYLNSNLNVTSIADGNNTTSTITYDYVTTASDINATQPKGTFCSLFPNMPFKIIKQPMMLTTNVVTSNISSEAKSNINYSYTDAKYYPYKGFLGFTTVTATNSITGAISTTTYTPTVTDANGINSFVSPYPSRSTTIRGALTSTSTTTVIAKKVDIKVHVRQFIPVTTKQTSTSSTSQYTTETVPTFDENTGLTTDNTTSVYTGSTTAPGNGSWTIVTNIKYDPVPGYTNVYRPRMSTETKTTYGQGQVAFPSSTIYGYDTKYPLRLYSITAGGKATTFDSYDVFGNPTAVTVKAGSDKRTSGTTYDGGGRFPISNVDALGYTSSATYRSGDGALLTKTDPNGLVTTYSYTNGSSWNTVTITPPNCKYTKTSIQWGASGYSIVNSETKDGNMSSKKVDGKGLEISADTYGHFYNKLSTSKTYNSDGTVATATDIAGNTTTYTYVDGRVSSETGVGVNNTYTYSQDAVMVTNKLANAAGTATTSTKTTDALGNVLNIAGTNGSIDYTYFSHGKVKEIKVNKDETKKTSMDYDPTTLYQTKLVDPDAGTTTYINNGFGQVISQTDANFKTISCTYDAGGRLLNKSGNVRKTYTYFDTPGQLGLLKSVTDGVTNITETYTYDAFYRTTSVTTSGGAINPSGTTGSFTSRYTYNSANQLASTTYPTGLIVNYGYDGVGYLTSITNTAGTAIWTGTSTNYLDQWTGFTQNGGSIPTVLSYDDNTHLPNSIKTGTGGSILNLAYGYYDSGQMKSRTETGTHITGGTISESFNYDALNRLTYDWVGTDPTRKHEYKYLPNGNIDESAIAGKYKYNAAQPHAVSSVDGIVPNPIPSTTYASAVTTDSYNAENKILTIDNGSSRSEFTYGIDGNRYRCDFYTIVSGVKTWQSSKVYIGGSEFGYFVDSRKNYARTIIKAPTGTCAVYQDSNSVKEFYYIHTDYQGSWLAITNTAKTVVKRNSYDAWGRPRNIANWTLKPVSVANALLNLSSMQPRFDRGYTGHEMVCGFGLINMNGRLYDPYLQRFLSPDPYVQSPGNAQSYNRYSYCMNNPLMYFDPTGYNWRSWCFKAAGWAKENSQTIGTIAGIAVSVAIIAATGGTATPLLLAIASGAGGFASGSISTYLSGGSGLQILGNGLMQGAIGFAAGYVGGTLGKAAGQGAVHLSAKLFDGAAMKIASPLINGAVFGAIGGAAGGGVTGFAVGFGSAYIASGGNLNTAWNAGLNGAAQGAIMGGAIGFASGAYSSYKYCSEKNINLWNGKSTSTSLAPYYPSNDGAAGNWKNEILPKGTVIDRVGNIDGNYFAPDGTPIEMRSLPYDVNTGEYNRFEILKPLPVQSSTVAPAFDGMGLGTQYRTGASTSDLIDWGYLKILK